MEADRLLPNGSPRPPTTATGSARSSAYSLFLKRASLADWLKLERQFVQVPFDRYKKTILSNCLVAEEEVSAVVSAVDETAAGGISCGEVVERLGFLVLRLRGLTRKLQEGSTTEESQAQRCRARLDHLESADPENLSRWCDILLKRSLVDYLLRMSYYDSAVNLAKASNIQDLVDIDMFLEEKKVIDALRKKESGPALDWCAKNISRFKELESALEFQLRLDDFVELVRTENRMRAVAYAQKHLAPLGPMHVSELWAVFAALALKSNDSECARYKDLFEPEQWDFLADQFRQEFYRLNGMTPGPLLHILLDVGLCALKTPFCNKDTCPKEDPLSQESFRKLAEQFSQSKQAQSKLLCHITGEQMDTDNPPLVLPNGYAYSTKALKEMAEKNDNKITCPRTGEVCNFSDLVRPYIL